LADAFLERFVPGHSGGEPASVPPSVLPSVLQCAALLEFEWLDHAFGTRHTGDWLAAHPALTLRQIHSNVVFRSDGLTNRQCEGDALISNEIGRRVGVRTADCVPILIADARTRAIAAVHAGWRGTASRVARAAVEKMAAEFGSQPEDLHAAMGPAIRECCYEVGAEVVRDLAPLFPEWRNEEKNGKRHIDLVEANRRVLREAGVSASRIYDCGRCTYSEPALFFSYRREPANPGRMVSSIVRVAE
jgi:YfiH family protein